MGHEKIPMKTMTIEELLELLSHRITIATNLLMLEPSRSYWFTVAANIIVSMLYEASQQCSIKPFVITRFSASNTMASSRYVYIVFLKSKRRAIISYRVLKYLWKVDKFHVHKNCVGLLTAKCFFHFQIIFSLHKKILLVPTFNKTLLSNILLM